MSINLVSLIGHVGRDPELRTFDSGSCTTEFTLALKRPAKEGQQPEPVWVRCKAWNQTARLAVDWLRKGAKVGLLGRLDQEEWTDRHSGEKRSRTVVVVTRLEFFDRPPQQGTATTAVRQEPDSPELPF